jgi:hypothetical protein
MGSGFLLFFQVFRCRVTQITSLNRLTGLVLYAIEANKKRIDIGVGGKGRAVLGRKGEEQRGNFAVRPSLGISILRLVEEMFGKRRGTNAFPQPVDLHFVLNRTIIMGIVAHMSLRSEAAG